MQAFSHTEAAELVNENLQHWPTKEGNNLEVENLAHSIVQVSSNSLSDNIKPQIIHGPWIESAIIARSGMPCWEKDNEINEWEESAHGNS
ncbi:MAG: hypothetical protein D3918_13100 [Candidatus Electrothrix sp. AX2]|nr:hypothetical protein [Candidatus Electrothrix gigas]